MKIIAIGDTHDAPDVDKQRFRWFGKYIRKVKPDAVVQIGDFITLDSWDGLFTSQSFCGDNLILAPLAPPLLSEPRKVEADAQAVETNCEIDTPDFSIFTFRSLISLFLILYLDFGIGSCQINFSLGTSGPK